MNKSTFSRVLYFIFIPRENFLVKFDPQSKFEIMSGFDIKRLVGLSELEAQQFKRSICGGILFQSSGHSMRTYFLF